MNSLLGTNNGIIGRLRLHVPQDAASDAERAVRRSLHGAALHPLDLPASALLCLRTLKALPAKRCSQRGLRNSADWERALHPEISRELAAAKRPAHEAVSPNANAVVFLDESELLAALTLDWLSDSLSTNWWWSQLLRNTRLGPTVVASWLERPRSAPAAFAILARRNRAVAFACEIPETEARNLLVALLEAHALKVPDEVDHRSRGSAAWSGGSATPLPTTSPLPLRSKEFDTNDQCDPSRMPIPEASDSRLTPIQSALVAYALMLSRQPSVARSIEFQIQISRLLSQAEQRQSGGAAAAAKPAADPVLPVKYLNHASPAELEPAAVAANTRIAEDARRPLPAPADGPAPVHVHVPENLEPSMCTTCESHTSSSVPAMAEPSHTPQATTALQIPEEPSQTVLIEEVEPSPIAIADREWTAIEQTTLAVPIASRHFAPLPLPRIETAFGGTFFLLNVAIALGLYPDFTAPLDAALETNIWDFLALFGDRYTNGYLRNDPLSIGLAELAGRDPDSEPVWLLGDFRQNAIDRQIRGFLVEALGPEQTPEFLCRLPATFTSTPTHVEIFFSMQTHPIEIRIACLDRDPGWIPAAGRYVAFHFD